MTDAELANGRLARGRLLPEQQRMRLARLEFNGKKASANSTRLLKEMERAVEGFERYVTLPRGATSGRYAI